MQSRWWVRNFAFARPPLLLWRTERTAAQLKHSLQQRTTQPKRSKAQDLTFSRPPSHSCSSQDGLQSHPEALYLHTHARSPQPAKDHPRHNCARQNMRVDEHSRQSFGPARNVHSRKLMEACVVQRRHCQTCVLSSTRVRADGPNCAPQKASSAAVTARHAYC